MKKTTLQTQCCRSGSGAFLPQESWIRIRDYFSSGSQISDPGSWILDLGSWVPDLGSRIPDPYHVANSIYLQNFTFKNGEKQKN
jgi:hypothetical protein